MNQTRVPRYAGLPNGGCSRRPASLVSRGMYQAEGSLRVEVQLLYHILHPHYELCGDAMKNCQASLTHIQQCTAHGWH